MFFFNKNFAIFIAVAGISGLSFGIIWQNITGNVGSGNDKMVVNEEGINAPVVPGPVATQRSDGNTVKSSNPGRSVASIPSPSMNRLQKNPRLKQFIIGNKLEDHYQQLALHFPEGPMGDTLLDFTTLLEWQEMVGSAESKYANEKFEYIQNHPEEALGVISMVFDVLPAKFSHERQQLMQYASKLKVQEEDRITFVMKEMTRPFVRDDKEKSAQLSVYNSSIALRSLANVVGDNPSRIEPHLREALESHKGDKETQRLLIHNFAKFDPEGADRLHEEYHTR